MTYIVPGPDDFGESALGQSSFGLPIGAVVREASDSAPVSADAATRVGIIFRRTGTDSLGTADNTTATGNVFKGIARPMADITTNGWQASAGGALYPMIDEPQPANDSDYIFSSKPPPAAELAEVRLQPAAATPTATNTRISYKINKRGARQGDLTVRLVQGTTTIASWAHSNLSRTPTQFDQQLSGVQLAAITNWSDLRLRFEATVT